MKRLTIWEILFLFLPAFVHAQEEYNHTELEWRTIETEHFFVHYQNGTERTAQEVAHIAECIFKPITEMYHHVPDQKVTFLIRDHDDYSNGATDFFNNRIELWAPSLDFELRGTHPWLWNVVTHEYTHMVQIQTQMKFGRKVPGFYFQWLSYEQERRPDVLYGYPNVIVSYPVSGFVIPNWFAEGVAQYNSPGLLYDYWDTHRDMILRMYMLDNNQLSWEEMAVFGKNSLGNESSYNAGFSLVKYIAEKYGTDNLQKISYSLGNLTRLDVDGAIEQVLDLSGEELYEQWKSGKQHQYRAIADSLKGNLREGEIIEPDGFGNFYPAFSPDGERLAYISNKSEDYFAASSIYLYNLKTKEHKLLVPKVRSSLSFSPDSKSIYYAKITRDNLHWSAYSDIYRYDIPSEKEERLTYSLRAFSPKLSPDGKSIIFAFGSDGTLNLGMCNVDGKNIHALTKYTSGEQVYTPVWSPDGKRIAFSYSQYHNQVLAAVDTNGSNLHFLSSTADARDPFYSLDGSHLYFAWDRTGIFNVYSMSLTSDSCTQITNVLGGAFLPTLNANSDLAYAKYTSTGYKIAILHDSLHEVHNSLLIPKSLKNIGDSLNASRSVSTISDTLPSREYRSKFTTLSLIPLIRIDKYNEHDKGIDVIKPGLYFTSNEMLDKMSVFGGAAVNRQLEYDLFLILEYHGRLPLFYQIGLEPTASVELYNITRKIIDYSFDLYTDMLRHFTTDVSFNLFEFDLSLRQPIIQENNILELRYVLSRYSQDFGSWLWINLVSSVVIPASRTTYLIGNTFSLQLKHDGLLPSIDKDINPLGRTVVLKYSYERNDFNPTDSMKYDNSGILVPLYQHPNFHRVELDWSEHLPLPLLTKHTISLELKAGSILGPTVDEFFDFFVGGFIGMRGYPYYAIGGNEMLTMNVTYRFPLYTEINYRFLQFYLKKIYGSVFYDVGNAWNGAIQKTNDWKHDAGFEVRLETFSWYAYPTDIFFSGAYSFDVFKKNFYGPLVKQVTYGNEWRFYLGILFGFDLNGISRSMKMIR